MPTKESLRVEEHQQKYFDRIPLLVEKGGRTLLRVLASCENTNVSEYIRRAILARAGLKVWPYNMEKLSGIENPQEAKEAKLRLQRDELTDDRLKVVIEKMSNEPNSTKYFIAVNKAELQALVDKMNETLTAAPSYEDALVTLTGKEVGILRRMLSNMTPGFVRGIPGSRRRT